MPRGDDSAAYAANWRTVLAVDAGLGLGASIVGVVLALTFATSVGVAVAVLGSGYMALVAMRARRWARLRRQARE